MRRRQEWIVDRYVHAQLLKHFSFQARGRTLALVDLPSRKLPLERQAHDLAPLRSEDLAVLFYDRTGYVKNSHEPAVKDHLIFIIPEIAPLRNASSQQL